MSLRGRTSCFLMLISLVGLPIVAQSLNFPDWQFSVSGWWADGSKFDEQPGPAASGHVWGDFPSAYGQLRVAKKVFDRFQVALAWDQVAILPSWMYLHSDTVYTAFEGNGYNLSANLAYRLPLLDDLALDVETGYNYTYAVKRFSDYTENGVILMPGNWGDYTISYQGPTFAAGLHYWFIPSLEFFGRIQGAPMVSNHTRVTGYGLPQEEDAQGLAYRWEGGFTYHLLNTISFSLGYRFEDIYFHPPADDSFSLSIVYRGLMISTSYYF